MSCVWWVMQSELIDQSKKAICDVGFCHHLSHSCPSTCFPVLTIDSQWISKMISTLVHICLKNQLRTVVSAFATTKARLASLHGNGVYFHSLPEGSIDCFQSNKKPRV